MTPLVYKSTESLRYYLPVPIVSIKEIKPSLTLIQYTFKIHKTHYMHSKASTAPKQDNKKTQKTQHLTENARCTPKLL